MITSNTLNLLRMFHFFVLFQPVVEENALAGRGDALTGGAMAGGAGKRKLDGNLNALVSILACPS
jgi:hypothetical protein